ncbi:MAG: IS66 family insertion sequence element accessory protein TnpB [Lentisphaerales bacterium]|nr:IS66 family insertion sequence element accessory protein TnpB [Lentisphaerales bacterium]
MIQLSSCRIFLCREATDMRKSFDGLAALVSRHFPDTEMTGSLFVFMNKRQTHLKAFYWDEDGYAIWMKRLRNGCFRKLPGDEKMISRRELTMLLEGIVPKRINKRFKTEK